MVYWFVFLGCLPEIWVRRHLKSERSTCWNIYRDTSSSRCWPHVFLFLLKTDCFFKQIVVSNKSWFWRSIWTDWKHALNPLLIKTKSKITFFSKGSCFDFSNLLIIFSCELLANYFKAHLYSWAVKQLCMEVQSNIKMIRGNQWPITFISISSLEVSFLGSHCISFTWNKTVLFCS